MSQCCVNELVVVSKELLRIFKFRNRFICRVIIELDLLKPMPIVHARDVVLGEILYCNVMNHIEKK